MITANKYHYQSKMKRLHGANEESKTKIVIDNDEGWGGDGRGVNWGSKYGDLDMGGWRNGGWKAGGWAGGLPRARENNGGGNKGCTPREEVLRQEQQVISRGGEVEESSEEGGGDFARSTRKGVNVHSGTNSGVVRSLQKPTEPDFSDE
ncbi:hypothetical protein P8452_49049 [Trifolium repens]|nr:hypothetical protein P8452_49049 [Trifolium repens]